MKPYITGALLVESGPGVHVSTTAHQARDLAIQYPLVSVTLRHNDTDVRVFGSDLLRTITDRWAAARGET